MKKQRNLVAKHARGVNKAHVHVDRKKKLPPKLTRVQVELLRVKWVAK